jgi:hypothetical protein
MTFQLVYTEKFEKRAIRFLKQHPDVKQKYLKTLQLFGVKSASSLTSTSSFIG